MKNSELILNPDGSVYHLNLKPEHLAQNVILVGDQDRVDRVSKYFDVIIFKTQKREFKTHTGVYKNTPISVVSTGIGVDNIDIVLNELDALVNINLQNRTIKEKLTTLNIVRVGTSGALQVDIPVDSIVVSKFGLGLDNMLWAYQDIASCTNHDLSKAFVSHAKWNSNKGIPIAVASSETLFDAFATKDTFEGITATAPGFYGSQGRVLRLMVDDVSLNEKLNSFDYQGNKITNFEMETSAIYGLSKLLGHKALSLNVIVANRFQGTFSQNPYNSIDRLIQYTLEKFASMHNK
ncbi:MAG: nucleoside phosphorylase [Bacteroidota bacterium]|nr:nucleoside phosphorylase [Bacteroidota bacterium]